jgi:hypothetical protein
LKLGFHSEDSFNHLLPMASIATAPTFASTDIPFYFLPSFAHLPRSYNLTSSVCFGSQL